MKRVGHLFDKICSIDNLELADRNARKGKKCISEIAMFDASRDALLTKLRESLISKTYRTSTYYIFNKVVDSGKERTIYRLPYYPDRILHHAIMNVLEPVFYRCFTNDTYSCIRNRGIHSAAKKVEVAIRQKECEFVLKLDIKKFYPSVDHVILKGMLRHKIKDNDLLLVLDELIDSADGLPIGNYLSQSFANFFLSGFDHWIKETKGVQYYFRYCDDMVIFGSDKAELHNLLQEITKYLSDINLTVKKNWRVFPVRTGIDFLGFVFYPTHTKIRKSIKKRFIVAVKRYQNIRSEKNSRSLASYWGWLKYSNSANLIRKTCV